MLFKGEFSDLSGKAADTGSAVHKAIAEWHGTGDVERSIATMREGVAAYPLADFHDAELHFHPYTKDPRNQARPKLVEQKVSFTLPPAEDDPTQKAIYVMGTLDQVREVNGVLRVYDVKTGDHPGWAMMNDHSYQIAAYAVGASEFLSLPVQPGAIISTRGYRRRGVKEVDPPGVFFEYAWTLEHARRLMRVVASEVARIRCGELRPGPGDWCGFCPAGGVEECVRHLD